MLAALALGVGILGIGVSGLIGGVAELAAFWAVGWLFVLQAWGYVDRKGLRSPHWWGLGLAPLIEELPTVRGSVVGRFETLPGFARERELPFPLLFAPRRLLFVVYGYRPMLCAALLASGVVPLHWLHPRFGGPGDVVDVAFGLGAAVMPALVGSHYVARRVVLHEIPNDDVLAATLTTDERSLDVRWRAHGVPEVVRLTPESAWFEVLRDQLASVGTIRVDKERDEVRAEAEVKLPAPKRVGPGAILELVLVAAALPAAVFTFWTGDLVPLWGFVCAVLTALLPFALLRTWLRHFGAATRRVRVSRPHVGLFDIEVKLRKFREFPLPPTLRGEGWLRTSGERWEIEVERGAVRSALAVVAWCAALGFAPGVRVHLSVVTVSLVGSVYAGALWGALRVAFPRSQIVRFPRDVLAVDVIAWTDELRFSFAGRVRPRHVDLKVPARWRSELLAAIEARWPGVVGAKHRAWAALPEPRTADDGVDPATERHLAAVQQRYQEHDT